MSRIINEKVELDSSKIHDFFSKRSKVTSADNPYISVLYQDKNSEVAIYRDNFEKKTILPLLKFNKKNNVLDLGCGVGRWAETTSYLVNHYIGVDFSNDFILEAKRRLEDRKNVDFKVMPVQDVSAEALNYHCYIDRVIISGVLIYLNDSDVVKCFKNLLPLLKHDALIYIREPLAIESRLTLNGIWSNEMEQEYFAIYRTKSELSRLICQGFGFEVGLNFSALYKDNIGNNRKETIQFYDIVKVFK